MTRWRLSGEPRSTRYRLVKIGLIFVVAFLIGLTFLTVPLTPRVDENFFFADDDPQLAQDRKIAKIFPKQEQIIINVRGQIRSRAYLSRIERLTDRLSKIPEVITAKSLTHGPKDFDDALTSEFWGRVLIPEDRKSSNIFILLGANSGKQAIPKIEAAVQASESADFQPVIAGVPYMIELIQRRLLYDIKVFSLCAVGIFGLIILAIFRSIWIVVGCLAASAAATSLTLLGGHAIGLEIGILTANLVALVFVLTIPHTIYFTYNWKRHAVDSSTGQSSVKNAFWDTLPGSFWSMGTTLLGFLSLLLVEAKPLRQLGASGSIGTICALVAAYGVYPVFLLGINSRTSAVGAVATKKNRAFVLIRYSGLITGGFVIVSLLLGMGVLRLNKDPSLLSYFPDQLRQGLELVDQTGGSSLLEIVLRDSRGRKLATNEAYERLWRLQNALERDPEVGTVISLPMLMAEGKDFPFSFLFSWKRILDIMARPKYERVAQNFISHDHLYGRFVLRMREVGRETGRAEVIERIERTVKRHGFTPVLIGNTYALQAQLSAVLGSSLIQGLGELVLLLGIIGFIVSRSAWVGLTMSFGMAMVPVALLGLIGILGAPLDVISAPAANLTLGLGIDDTMIHMAQRWRELVKSGRKPGESWDLARAQLWRPIVVSMLVICAGFSIFLLSQFPPTQRFGLWVVIGTLLVLPAALFFLPTVASIWSRMKSKASL
ncbi:MAG: MMPL family transporter [Deltaproteobacteria bacterium]|nr:MMPL family transporter [Deltaproteobacteria bacterium]